MEKQNKEARLQIPRICRGTCVPCEVGISSADGQDRGVGLFTINTLKAGTLIWKYDVDEYDESEARMKLDSLSSPEEKKLWVEHIFAWKEKIVILKDDLELINHSLKPNVFFSQQDGNIRALKEIDSGDEMLIDYQQLGSYPEFYLKMMEEVGSWFSSRIESNQRD